MDTFEELAHLYFRLNGFFTIPNYILHDPALRTDIDVLAVRFPYKREEVAGRLLEDDPSLQLLDNKIEVVLAEVKRTEEEFNPSWTKPRRMEYVLNFVGIFDSQASVQQASRVLASSKPFEDSAFRIRPILCTASPSIAPDLTHARLDSMLDFVVRRFREHEGYKRYQPQWADTLAGKMFCLASSSDDHIALDDIDRPR